MFVEKVKNNGIDYLRLVQGVRVTNKNGYRTSQKKVILNLGPLSRFDDGEPDYIGRLKQSFKDRKPLIPELLPYVEEKKPEKYTVTFEAGNPHCFGRPKWFAPCVLDPVFSALGLDELCFVNSFSSKSERKFPIIGWGIPQKRKSGQMQLE